ncbi:DNA-directed RNA polymerase subunit L [Candidatus Micrarchaeota archaeon]|nr:MAG: DNA-directed RNA polymerase subunit L [Candidatus Micrarchaeota archaeon]
MRINIISNRAKQMEFSLEGEGHLFAQLLVSKLLEDKDVEVAQYTIDHPLTGLPTFFLKTKSKKPVDALKKAVDSLKRDINSLAKAFK